MAQSRREYRSLTTRPAGLPAVGAAALLAIAFAGQCGAMGWDGAIRFDEPQGIVIRLGADDDMTRHTDALGRTWANGLPDSFIPVEADDRPIDI